MRTFLAISALSILLWAGPAAGQKSPNNAVPLDDDMPKIRIKTDDQELTATLDKNAAANDFLALLPVTLTLTDYAGTEKVSNLSERLSTEGSPEGYDPSIGDITYYAPWGNLAIFYRDFGYARGLVRLGQIDGGARLFERSGEIRVSIELAD